MSDTISDLLSNAESDPASDPISTSNANASTNIDQTQKDVNRQESIRSSSSNRSLDSISSRLSISSIQESTPTSATVSGTFSIPSFTSTYYAGTRRLRRGSSISSSVGSPQIPVIVEDSIAPDQKYEDDDEDDAGYISSDTEHSGNRLSTEQTGRSRRSSASLSGQILHSPAPQSSLGSSTDSLSSLSSTATGSANTATDPSLHRTLPQLSSATFTSLSSSHPSRPSTTSVYSSVSRHAPTLPKLRRSSTSSHRNLSAISLIMEDNNANVTNNNNSSSSLSAKSHTSKRLKKASSASLASLSKGKPTDPDPSSHTSSIRRPFAGQFSKSRFFFMPKQSSPKSPPLANYATGSRSTASHRMYKLRPTESTANGGSSASSSNSSSTSLSSTPTASLVNVSQAALFVPASKESKSRKSPVELKPVDVRRLSISSSQNSPLYSSFPSTTTLTSINDKHKHHLLLRSRKDTNPGAILSSSSSNSRLTSDAGSIYSFNPSAQAPYAPYGLQKSISSIDVKTLSYRDINKISGDQALEDVWPFLCARVTPLFAGEGLRVPVEDLNKLVLLHTKRRISEKDPGTLISEVRDIVKLGVSVFDTTSQALSYSDSDLVEHVTQLWRFYYTAVVPYMCAVFLPLQLEFEGDGVILSKSGAAKFWEKQKVQPPEMNNTKKMVLASFRDWIVLPLYNRLNTAITSEAVFLNLDTLASMLQCFCLLAEIKSADSKQEKVHSMTKAIRTVVMKIHES
ncbi:HbrB-like-domain-containing protein [Lipomyces oligophaga]|uniref:HbrB-like-domain-containing protein n=1 Tax=Lipomyces oligophaga TaxID=45792 RepID=UPI0034CED8D7